MKKKLKKFTSIIIKKLEFRKKNCNTTLKKYNTNKVVFINTRVAVFHYLSK